MDCSPPDSSVCGIFQARILEWFAISFSRGSSQSRIKPRSPVLQVGSLLTELPLLSEISQSSKAIYYKILTTIDPYMVGGFWQCVYVCVWGGVSGVVVVPCAGGA